VRFDRPLVAGRFLRREKRFLVHAELTDGRRVVAHTNNTGSMKGCLTPGHRLWLSPAANPARKLQWTLEIVEAPSARQPGRRQGPIKVGVNTLLANRLVREAMENGVIGELSGYHHLRSEVQISGSRSRIDFALETEHRTGAATAAQTWVEVKNVSLVEAGRGLFPDAPTERGRRHLAALAERAAAGDRAVLVFCIQRAKHGARRRHRSPLRTFTTRSRRGGGRGSALPSTRDARQHRLAGSAAARAGLRRGLIWQSRAA